MPVDSGVKNIGVEDVEFEPEDMFGWTRLLNQITSGQFQVGHWPINKLLTVGTLSGSTSFAECKSALADPYIP